MSRVTVRDFAPKIVAKAQRALRVSLYFARTGYWHDGERVNPDFEDANFINHRKVYLFIAQLVTGKVVLDVGCGTGYGTAILADSAKHVTGIDYASSENFESLACLNTVRKNRSAPTMRFISFLGWMYPTVS